MVRLIVLVPVLLLWGSSGISAQNDSVEWRIEKIAGLKVPEVQRFLKDLKTGVAARDSKAICAMVSYPLVTRSGKVTNPAACAGQYKRIFNQKVVDAVGRQRFENLFVNDQGVMIGDGEVWMSGVCKDKKCEKSDLRITRVNN